MVLNIALAFSSPRGGAWQKNIGLFEILI